MFIATAIVLIAACAFGFHLWSKKQARRQLLDSALTEHERTIIRQQVPLIQRLPAKHQGKLEGKICLFLDQVEFFGCNGLEVTEEMQLSIAAQACLLVVNSSTWYDNLSSILIYPSAFKSKQKARNGFVVSEKDIVRTGESWSRGPVVLSWAHSQQGALNDHDGHNVVLHEFAHQIDDLSGRTNGVPILSEGQTFAEWERVFLTAYEAHLQAVERGQNTVIDPYGAEGHEEFFAVSVEVFFERPAVLKEDAPEVYEQLAKLFKLEPITWH
ncbi:Protein MtfA [Roseovarius albus]|uniref:Protein MtfA n=1 Tax=Roseovarius albus TaxID=1247867 RepID=A0A1X6YFP0_9RHOB|nr:M90 family metallopeptidase [Roseovarius albus]SLN18054.1 Protein MtfA [Roseovarius albus]